MPNALTEFKGFTPLIDVLVDELGLIPATVYGVVWRYCQMQSKVCQASIETIANKVGLGHRTVQRHLRTLCEQGYLRDTTPNLRHRPHTYSDTGKAKISGLVEADVGMSERHTSEQVGMSERRKGTSESRTRYVRESHKDTSLRYKKILGFAELSAVCRVDLRTITKRLEGQLKTTANKLRREANVTPADITAFGEWWYSQDWRGKKGQAPSPSQVRDKWGEFTAWRKQRQETGIKWQDSQPPTSPA